MNISNLEVQRVYILSYNFTAFSIAKVHGTDIGLRLRLLSKVKFIFRDYSQQTFTARGLPYFRLSDFRLRFNRSDEDLPDLDWSGQDVFYFSQTFDFYNERETFVDLN